MKDKWDYIHSYIHIINNGCDSPARDYFMTSRDITTLVIMVKHHPTINERAGLELASWISNAVERAAQSQNYNFQV